MAPRFGLDGGPQQGLQFRIRGARTDQRLQIYRLVGEKTGPQLSVAGQSDAIALTAEVMAHCTDETDHPGGTMEPVIPCGPAFAHSDGGDGTERRDPLPDLLAGNIASLGPAFLRRDGHELNESDLVRGVPSQAREIFELIRVDPSNGNHVDLHRRQADLLGF